MDFITQCCFVIHYAEAYKIKTKMKFKKRSHSFRPKILNSTCTKFQSKPTIVHVKRFKIKLEKQLSITSFTHMPRAFKLWFSGFITYCPILIVLPCDGKSHVENSRANFNRRDLISYRQQPTSGIVYYSVNIFQHGENQTPASDENKQKAKGTVKGG